MTSSACQNPSLTYMALAARASHYAVWAAGREEIQAGDSAPGISCFVRCQAVHSDR